jgi:hypothetical protein
VLLEKHIFPMLRFKKYTTIVRKSNMMQILTLSLLRDESVEAIVIPTNS